MKSGKRVVCILIMSLLLIVSISFVSAAWKDIFNFGKEDKNLEGELAAVHDVSIQLDNTAPSIVKFLPVTETTDNINGVTALGVIQGAAGGTAGTGFVSVKFKFTVTDPDNTDNTGDDLPGGPGSAVPITYGTNLNVIFTAPTGQAISQTVSAGAGDCIAASCNGNVECADSIAPTKEVIYTCNIDMYYFNPRTNGAPSGTTLWKISVTIKDDTGVNSDSEQSGNTGFNVFANDYIQYQTIAAVSLPGATTLQWVVNKLDVNAINNPADAGIATENAGNVAIASENIIAKDLVDPTNNANKINANAFAVDNAVGTTAGAGACFDGGTADILTNNVAVPVTIAIPYTGAGIATDKTTFYYCAYPIINPTYLQGVQAQSYVANVAKANQWAINYLT